MYLRILNLVSLDKSVVSILGYLSEVSNLAATSYSSAIPIMLSKSNFSELTMLSESIYLLSTSSEVQAKLSAQYAVKVLGYQNIAVLSCLLYTSPSPRDVEESRMPSSA